MGLRSHGGLSPLPPGRAGAQAGSGQPGGHRSPSRTGRHAQGVTGGRAPLPPAATVLAGRYLLAERLGGPDTGSLWKGTDELLARPVTVRVFRPGPVPATVAAALRGAGRLTDPRLARIYDADDCADCGYIVSEWVPGAQVDELLRTGLPGPGLAARIAAQAAGALAAAHAAGQAHLCLTPDFVRWTGSGVKITGLGIEAALAGLPSMATPQAAAEDARALGGLLYALLTGCWPGPEQTILPPAPRRLGRLRPPAQVVAGVPGRLDAIVCRTLLTRAGPASRLASEPACGPQIGSPAQFARALAAARGAARRDVPARARLASAA